MALKDGLGRLMVRRLIGSQPVRRATGENDSDEILTQAFQLSKTALYSRWF